MYLFCISLILLTQITYQRTCPDNCRFCPLADSTLCSLCDSSLNQFKQNNECQSSSIITNCNVFNINEDKCNSCNKGYTFQANQCTEVDTSGDVQCDSYKGEVQLCNSCPEGNQQTGLDSSTCSTPSIAVQNCLHYNKDGCNQCKSGYRLTNEGICTEMTSSGDNCLLYTDFVCNSCGDFQQYDDTKISDIFKPSNMPAEVLLSYQPNRVKGWPELKVCHQKSYVDNCIKFFEPFRCLECHSDYYLNPSSTECLSNPTTPIFDCNVFKDVDLTECTECRDSYYFNNDNTQCIVVPEDKFGDCIKYDNSINTLECMQCIDGKYASGGESCTDYDVTITNCDIFEYKEDKCKVCKDNYTLTNTSKCSLIVNNCKEYDDDDGCIQCNDYHQVVDFQTCNYIDSKCVEYDGPQCKKCEQNFVLDGSFDCVQRDYIIDDCEELSQTINNDCDKCNKGSLFISSQFECIVNKSILNCSEYSDPDTCSKCKDTFSLESNICVSIDPPCLNKVDEKCIKCIDSHKLIKEFGFCQPEYQSLKTCTHIRSDGLLSYCEDDQGIFIDTYDFHNSTICEAEDLYPTIEGCIVYDTSGCTSCERDYYQKLNDDGLTYTCESTSKCTMMTIFFQNKIKCETKDSLPGCQIASEHIDDVKDTCVQCKEDHIPVQKCSNIYSSFPKPNELSYEDQKDSQYSQVGCDNNESNEFTFNNNETETNDNCEFYKITGNGDRYFCQKCVFGYTGEVVYDVDADMSYVDCSDAIQYCEGSIVYGGLQTPDLQRDLLSDSLIDLFSCHQCEGDKIPFVHRSIQGHLKSFDITQQVPTDGSGNVLTQCKDITNPVEFGVDNVSEITIVDNCGLGFWAVDYKKNFAPLFGTIICVACKSGFEPTYEDGFITSCDAIENCMTTGDRRRFNGCQQCEDGYASIITEERITGCKESTVGVEYVYEFESKDKIICSSSHMKSGDDKCIDVNNADCKLFKLNHFLEKDLDFEFLKILSLKTNYYQGCITCEDDQKLFISPQTLSSSDLNDFNNGTANPVFIKNCNQYAFDLDCYYCDAKFSMKEVDGSDKDECVDEIIDNCSTIKSDVCSDCVNNYQLVNSVCQLNPVNCEKINTGGTDISCDKCNNGYGKLFDDKCVKKQDNCEEYNLDGTCKLCMMGYFQLKNTATVCLPLPTDQLTTTQTYNLLWADNIYVQSELKCFGEKKEKKYQRQCEVVQQLDNCKKYVFDQEYDILTIIDFLCEECEVGFYKENGLCLSYDIIENCMMYDASANECDKCEEGYGLDVSGDCKVIIFGLPGCLLYEQKSQAAKCSVCDNKSYKDNKGNCLKIQDLDLLEHCNEYTYDYSQSIQDKNDINYKYNIENVKCKDCNDNYQVERNGGCEGPGPTNCNKWTNINGSDYCDTCLEGYTKIALYDSETLTFEVLCHLPSVLPDCIELDTDNSSELACKQCKTGYFLHTELTQQTCKVIVESAVDNCQLYGSSSQGDSLRVKCVRCEKGYILKQLDSPYVENRVSQCVSVAILPNSFPNCYLNHVEENQECSICADGYYLKSGQCLICAAHNNVHDCSVCNPFNPRECFVCKEGGKCWPNNLEIGDTNQSGSGLIKIALLFFIIFQF